MNLDESFICETNFTRQIWFKTNASASVPIHPVSHRLAMIAALDTEGRLYYTLSQANTDQNVMLVFLTHLVEVLD